MEGVRIERPAVVNGAAGVGRRLPEAAGRVLTEGVLGNWVLPALMALVAVLGISLTASRLNLLLDWSDRYDASGEHLTLGCQATDLTGGDGWICEGALVPDGSTVDVRSELVTSRGALVSDRPHVGQRTDVFFDRDQLGTAYPLSYRLNELARLYLSLLPRLLVAGGALIWLAGWFLTRSVDESDLIARDTVRLPGRFLWQTRGARWLVVAALVLGANHLLTTRVIGSLGTF